MTRVLVRAMVIFVVSLACWAASTLAADEKPSQKMKAAAIQVIMPRSDEIKLPAEFQVALYEDLIRQLAKNGGVNKIYRDGDHAADNAADVVVLRSTVTGFKEGSEKLRQVTTVAGSTSINVHCEFSDKNGKLLLERNIKGNVKFFGENLRATYDFAKKAARIAHDNFSPTAGG
jgi:hypothetical protein